MHCNTKASGARIRELRIAKNFTQDDLAVGEIQGAAVADVTNGNAEVTNVMFKTCPWSSKIKSQRKLTVP